MVHVRKNIPRCSDDLIERFRSVSAATVHEAMGRRGALDCAIKPLAEAEDVLEASLARDAKEAKVMERLRAGESLYDVYGYAAVLERLGCVEEDYMRRCAVSTGTTRSAKWLMSWLNGSQNLIRHACRTRWTGWGCPVAFRVSAR